MNRRIAITGAAGFIGRALAERIDRETGFESVRIVRCDFEQGRLFERLAGCEAVVHLAGLSRGDDPEALYQVNMELTESVAEAVMRTASIRRMVFCSTTHEAKESAYHASKRDGRAYFDVVAAKKGIESIGVLMPNVFGPGGRPFYNSVVATFCKLRSENKPLTVHPGAGSVKLIYIDSLVEKLLTAATASGVVNPLILSEEYEVEVAEIARLLESFDLNGCPQERFARDLWKSINLIP